MTHLVDSDYIIDGLAARPDALSVLEGLASHTLWVSIITLGEVYEGAFRRADSDVAFARYRHFLNGYRVLPLNDGTMLLFAEHRARLRAMGTMLADMDLLIACTDLQHDLTLVTRNLRHFARVPGLRIHSQVPT